MALENIMQIAGRAMDAQTIRMNLSVSNISNNFFYNLPCPYFIYERCSSLISISWGRA